MAKSTPMPSVIPANIDVATPKGILKYPITAKFTTTATGTKPKRRAMIFCNSRKPEGDGSTLLFIDCRVLTPKTLLDTPFQDVQSQQLFRHRRARDGNFVPASCFRRDNVLNRLVKLRTLGTCGCRIGNERVSISA
jgi:hypothetical protein